MKHVLRNDFLADSVSPPLPSHSAAPKKKCFTVLRTCERVVSPTPLSLRVCGARFAFELLALQALAMYIAALRSVRLSGAKRYYTAFVFHFMCFFSPAGASRARLKSSPSAPTQDRGKSRSCVCVCCGFFVGSCPNLSAFCMHCGTHILLPLLPLQLHPVVVERKRGRGSIQYANKKKKRARATETTAHIKSIARDKEKLAGASFGREEQKKNLNRNKKRQTKRKQYEIFLNRIAHGRAQGRQIELVPSTPATNTFFLPLHPPDYVWGELLEHCTCCRPGRNGTVTGVASVPGRTRWNVIKLGNLLNMFA